MHSVQVARLRSPGEPIGGPRAHRAGPAAKVGAHDEKSIGHDDANLTT
jgi:hypothetical protein